MENLTGKRWHPPAADEVINLLSSNREYGLDLSEIEERQARFGPHTITAKKGMGPLHVGSPSLLSLLQEKRPLFHVFAHIHEAFGHKSLGDVICCNVVWQWGLKAACVRTCWIPKKDRRDLS